MFLRNIFLYIVTALPIHAACDVSCDAELAGRAVKHAIAQARSDQKELRLKAIEAVAQFKVYIPVGILNETGSILTQHRALLKTIRSLRDAEADSFQSQQLFLERRLEVQFRAILAHPKNQNIFKMREGKEIRFSAIWDMDLSSRRSLPLETRMALTALNLAANNLAQFDNQTAMAVMEAGAAAQQYYRAVGDINRLRETLQTPMGKMTREQLQAQLALLEEQKKSINAEFLDQTQLPEPLQMLLNDLTETASPSLDFLDVQVRVGQAERLLSPGWELTYLITNGMLYYTSDMEKDVIAKALRRIVIDKNRERLMPKEDAKRLGEIENQIRAGRLTLSKIKK